MAAQTRPRAEAHRTAPRAAGRNLTRPRCRPARLPPPVSAARGGPGGQGSPSCGDLAVFPREAEQAEDTQTKQGETGGFWGRDCEGGTDWSGNSSLVYWLQPVQSSLCGAGASNLV